MYLYRDPLKVLRSVGKRVTEDRLGYSTLSTFHSRGKEISILLSCVPIFLRLSGSQGSEIQKGRTRTSQGPSVDV